jgi:transposase
MMFIDSKGLRVFLYQENIDMRSGFEKLTHYVRDVMKNNINQGHLYLFLGKNRRRLKAIFYDGTGLVQVSKKIERGRFMARSELPEINEITTSELKQLFHGGLVVRARVERSFVTQVGQDLLPKGNLQDSIYVDPPRV